MRIGLTGGIASGKSTVATRLQELGAVVIDADQLAREVVEPGTSGLAAVIAAFGERVLGPDGYLDRAALGRIVFADTDARSCLEGIIHPKVRQLAALREAAAPAGSVIVQVIPLLVETGQAEDFDCLVVVDVPEEVQLARAVARDAVAQDVDHSPAAGERVKARIAAQVSRSQRLAAADVVLDNSGTRESLIAQTDALWASWNNNHPS